MNSNPFAELLQQQELELEQQKSKEENSPLNNESRKIALAISKKNIEISFL